MNSCQAGTSYPGEWHNNEALWIDVRSVNIYHGRTATSAIYENAGHQCSSRRNINKQSINIQRCACVHVRLAACVGGHSFGDFDCNGCYSI